MNVKLVMMNKKVRLTHLMLVVISTANKSSIDELRNNLKDYIKAIEVVPIIISTNGPNFKINRAL